MNVDEFLIKIGVDVTQANKINDVINQLISLADKADKTGKDLVSSMKDVGTTSKKTMEETASGAAKAESKMKKLKVAFAAIVAGAVLFGKRIANAFNSAIDNVKNLIGQQNGLFKITQRDLNQAKQYQIAMSKTRLVIESVATKIALTLAPAITNIANGFSKWLVANKDLVVKGISVAIKFVTGFIQLISNGLKSIGFIVDKTIGWKGAMLALAAAFIYFKRAFLLSPIGLIVGAIAAILLIVDDLMVYLEGGESYFGEFWGACIGWIKMAITWWKNLDKNWKTIIYGILGYIGLLVGSKGIGSIGKTVLSMSKIFIKAFGLIGKSVLAVGRIMMANPILFIIAAIATAAYLIYDNWDELKTFFSNFWANVTGFFKNGIKDILMYFGMSEGGAESTVNAIGDTFNSIIDFITAPFKAAWKLIKDLFGIWTDDSTSFTEKFGKSFSAIYDTVTAPFKKAIGWIKDKFFGFINTVKDKFKMILGWIGIDIGGSDEFTEKDSESLNRNTKAAASVFAFGGDVNPNMPVARNGAITNRSTSVNQNVENNITVNTSDTSVGANQVADLLTKSLKTATDNSKTAMGVN